MSEVYFASGPQGWRLTGRVHDLAIPLVFDGPQPSYFGAEVAAAEPMRGAGFVGDTRRGGSCNAVSVRLNPHCNGTHTECVGHLTQERASVNDYAPALPILACVMSVAPTPLAAGDTKCIDRTDLDAIAGLCHGARPSALVVRTLPNSTAKLTRSYQQTADFPYFTVAAVSAVINAGIDHLLVDTPSLDGYDDNGRLDAHRTFFGLPGFDQCAQVSLKDAKRGHATVTEMIYVPDEVVDGLYLLNLQMPSFCLDAAPSRPLLYELEMS